MGVQASVSANGHDYAAHAVLGSKEWAQQTRLRRSSFEYDHRLKQSLDAQPYFIDGSPSLVVAPDLEIRDPFAFAYIRRFAQENELAIVLDRRTRQQSVDVERRAA
ncbi:MAG: DUF3579 domain-containing protein [Gammaproteobacteria bacterium]|nr:DUF3579 domain-containing protein [Gammaproteobacteria bacterium]